MNLKSKSTSISSNNRRGKKSAARLERSKQILSKSCERKQSKKKRNKVIQIVQNQCINLKNANTTELIFNWPLKQTNTMKNEFAKRTLNDSKLGFMKERINNKSNSKTRNMIVDTQITAKPKYKKLLAKKNDVFEDMPSFLNKTVTSEFYPKPLTTTKSKNIKKANLNKSRNIGFIRPSKTEF